MAGILFTLHVAGGHSDPYRKIAYDLLPLNQLYGPDLSDDQAHTEN